MEKALKILKELLVDVKKDIEAEGIDGFGYIETQLEKSIVELEYAMKPKTCDGCVREEEDMQDPHCAFCSRVCSDNFEAKDTQC